jgi:hypothetical protein
MAHYNKKKNQKPKGMKPEVVKIFEELEAYHDHCRFELKKFDPADLFKSKEWQRFNEGRKRKAAFEAREAKRQAKKMAELKAKHES